MLSVLSSLRAVRVAVLMLDIKLLSRPRLGLDDLQDLGVECELRLVEFAVELSSVPSGIWTVFIPRARLVITR